MLYCVFRALGGRTTLLRLPRSPGRRCRVTNNDNDNFSHFGDSRSVAGELQGAADVFDVEAHPTMTYRSTGVRRHGDGFVVDGQLTLKGVTRDVPLALELNGFGPDAYVGTRAGFTATAEISRGDFGINWNAPLPGGGQALGNDVTLTVELQLVKAEA